MEQAKTRQQTMKEWLLITLGIVCLTIGVYFFKFPNHFSTGGVSGLSVILAHYFPKFTPGTFVTVINVLLLVVGSILLTRNLKVDHISKRQAALEALYSLGKNFFEGLLGKEGSRYVPYLMTVALYIACSNVIGVFGVKPPTKDLDVTAALALMSIVLIEYAGVRARGGAGFLKSLAAPTPIMTPMNILEIAIRPTSLCMRLFGNVLGAFVIMELLKLVVPVFVPAVFSLYFDLFDGLIQTYVFVFLTALFMKESIGGEE